MSAYFDAAVGPSEVLDEHSQSSHWEECYAFTDEHTQMNPVFFALHMGEPNETAFILFYRYVVKATQAV